MAPMEKETIAPVPGQQQASENKQKPRKLVFTLFDEKTQPVLLILITIAFLLVIRYVGLSIGGEYKLLYAILVILVYLLLLTAISGPASRRVYHYQEGEKGFEDSVDISQKVFLPLAAKNIDIFSGELNSKFYNTPGMADTFKGMEGKGVTVNCVYGPSFDIETIELAKLAVAGEVNLFRLNKRSDNEVHFRMVDKKHICYDLGWHPTFGGYVGGKFDINSNYISRLYFKWKFKKVLKNAEKVNILDLAKQTVKSNNNESVEWFIVHEMPNKPRRASQEEIIKFISKIEPVSSLCG